jgi:uncharacterized membrane protein
MYAAELSNFSLWWLFPVVMIVICFLVMRGRKGSIMCGFGSGERNSHDKNISDSAKEILDKRYARGEIDEEEYRQRKKILNQGN